MRHLVSSAQTLNSSSQSKILLFGGLGEGGGVALSFISVHGARKLTVIPVHAIWNSTFSRDSYDPSSFLTCMFPIQSQLHMALPISRWPNKGTTAFFQNIDNVGVASTLHSQGCADTHSSRKLLKNKFRSLILCLGSPLPLKVGIKC